MTFRPLNILISHECSGVSRRAWRALGHNAYSCDLLPATDGEKEFHLQGDGIAAMRRGCPRVTAGGTVFHDPWDCVLTHFVCKYLANSGSLRLYRDGKKANGLDLDRYAKMRDGGEDFRRQFLVGEYQGPLAAENPVMHYHAREIIDIEGIAEANGVSISIQTIQPYQFGDDASKATQLWLRDLPALVVPPRSQWCPPRMVIDGKPRWSNQTASGQNKLGPSEHRAATRAITYPGIAQAMAAQWSAYLLSK